MPTNCRRSTFSTLLERTQQSVMRPSATGTVAFRLSGHIGHSADPDHVPFREDFSSAGWDLLW